MALSPPLLEVRDLVRTRRERARPWSRPVERPVLHGIDLRLAPGGALGVVGESGSGKSTLARAILGLERPQAGRIAVAGDDVWSPERGERRRARSRVQAVLQDPVLSLDPRWTVARIVAEPLRGWQRQLGPAERRVRVIEVLAEVGLAEDVLDRRPHAFSGGQRQRIAIARALVTRPALVVADEPVSALDVSIQAQVIALIARVRAQRGVGWVFISHDLAVVRAVCDEVVVLSAGRVVEHGPTTQILSAPVHPETQALVAAALLE